MKLEENIDELQKLLNFISVEKSLKGAGIGSIIFGAIALAMGIISMSGRPLNMILALIGGLLLIEGLWIKLRPSPKGLVADGIALMVLGVWNVFVGVMNIKYSENGGSGIIFAIIQFALAGRSFTKYKELSVQPKYLPSELSQARIKELVKGISKAKPAVETDIITVNTANLFERAVWKARLFDNAALFVQGKGDIAMVGLKERVGITSPVAKSSKRILKAEVRIGDKLLKGNIPADHYNRYLQWKSSS